MLLSKPTVAVYALAFFARIGAQFALGAFAHPETWEYEVIANNLLSGHGYTYMVDQTPYVAYVSSPLYVLLTTGVYLLTNHSQTALLILQSIVGAATAALAAWLAARLVRVPQDLASNFAPQRSLPLQENLADKTRWSTPPPGPEARSLPFKEEVAGKTQWSTPPPRLEAGWVAGCLVALDPGLLVYATKLHPLTLDAFAFLALVCACIALPPRPGVVAASLLGVLVGVVALTRTTVLSLLPVLVLWAGRFRSMQVRSAVTLAVVALIVYSPWPVRNSLLLGQFVPGSSESTEWLWRGANPNATGSSLTEDGRSMLDAAPSDFQARIGNASEAERIGIYRDAALQYIAQHPVDALRLYVLKLKGFWWGSENTGLSYPASWTMLYDAWYAAVLALGAAGVWWTRRDPQARSAVGLILASLVLISLTQALFYVEGRHRLAVEPLLLVLAGIGLVYLASLVQFPRLQAQRRRLT